MENSKTHALIDELSRQERTDRSIPDNVTLMVPAIQDNCEPSYDVQNEKPWHRLLAYLLLRGRSCKDAAKAVNKTKEHCLNVRKQKWFKELSAQLAAEHFDNDVCKLLEGATVEAITTLTDLVATAKSESVRRSAASDLLAMYFRNKPQVVLEAPDDPKEELAAIENELKILKEQDT